MKYFETFTTFILLVVTASSSHAIDPQQLIDYQRRISNQSALPLPNQQQYLQSRREGNQNLRPVPDSLSATSQLPQPQVISVDRMQASPDSIQPEAPAEYQAQAVPMFAAEQPPQPAEVVEPVPPEEPPAGPEQVVNPEPPAPVEEVAPEPEPEPEPVVIPPAATEPHKTVAPLNPAIESNPTDNQEGPQE